MLCNGFKVLQPAAVWWGYFRFGFGANGLDNCISNTGFSGCCELKDREDRKLTATATHGSQVQLKSFERCILWAKRLPLGMNENKKLTVTEYLVLIFFSENNAKLPWRTRSIARIIPCQLPIIDKDWYPQKSDGSKCGQKHDGLPALFSKG